MDQVTFLFLIFPVWVIYHCIFARTVMVWSLYLRKKQVAKMSLPIEARRDRFRLGFMFDFSLNNGLLFGILFHIAIYFFWELSGLFLSLLYPISAILIILLIPLQSIEKVERINLNMGNGAFNNAHIYLKNKTLQSLIFINEKFVYISIGIAVIYLIYLIIFMNKQ